MINQVEEMAGRIKKALREANDWSLKTRIQWLKWLDHLVANRKDEILSIVAKEKNASEHQVLLNEYTVIRSLCRYYKSNAYRILKDENRSRLLSLVWANKKVIIKKEPLGLVVVISPSNYPFSLPMGAVISALLAGNGVLLKTASGMPEITELINRLVKDSLEFFGAKNIFEIIRADRSIGKDLIQCKLVDKIHFTGSVETGRWIIQENAKVRLTPPTLELGGSNAAIVLEDADIKNAAGVILWARFCGMSCNNIKRVYVVEPIYEEFCQEIESRLKQLQEHEIGPIPAKEILNYQRFIKDYLNEYPDSKIGEEIKPRILRISQPETDLLVLKEETFVPLLPIVKVADEGDAVNFANQSRFGLGASIFTKDKKRFKRISEKLECGGVFHNDAMTEFAQPQVPFGGRKESGFGYSHGPEGLLEFVRHKAVIIERWSAPKLQLYPWTQSKMKWFRKLINLIIKIS